MSRLRFNHVFLGLLVLSALCAFLVPRRYTNLLRGRVDALFAPVAYPLRKAAAAVTGRIQPPAANLADAQAPARIEGLRNQVANLTMQLAEMQRLSANRELMGDAQKYSAPFKVIGADQGSRESLLLQGSARDGLAVGTPVVLRDGMVGRVANVGGGGAQVLLITDARSRISGAFGRFRRTADGREEFVPLPSPPPLVEGRGGGLMGVGNLSLQQIKDAGVRPGDWLVLWDDDWPRLVKGYYLGQVVRIEEQTRASWFAEVVVAPRVNLRQLSEVMAVVGRPAPAAAPAHANIRDPGR